MKLFTHNYVIRLYKNGRFCWKNKGWVEKEDWGEKEEWSCTLFDLWVPIFVVYAIYSHIN